MRILFLILLWLCNLSIIQGQAKNFINKNYLILGHVVNFKDSSKVYVTGNFPVFRLDSSRIVNGNFKLKGFIKEPAIVEIQIPGYLYIHNFVIEPGIVQVTIDTSKKNIEVRGGEFNKQFQTYLNIYKEYEKQLTEIRDNIKTFRNKKILINEQKEKESLDQFDSIQKLILLDKKRFIIDHRNSVIATYAIFSFLNEKNFHEAEKLYYILDKSTQNSESGEALIANILKYKNPVLNVGNILPAFKFYNKNGQILNLNTLEKTFTLIDFWATWCIPCLAQMPELKKIYQDHEKYSFEIISISLDKSSEMWRKKLTLLDLKWPNVIVPDSLNKKFLEKFNIKNIPFSLLIDKRQRILMVNPSTQEVKEFLSQRN